MPGLTLKIEGSLGSIVWDAFAQAVLDFRYILRDIDAGISGVKSGSLDWVITDLKSGSVAISAEPRPRQRGKDFGQQVMHSSVLGMHTLEVDGLTPPYLSETGMYRTQKLVKLIGSCGITGIRIANTSEAAHLSARASANIDQLLPTNHASIGSVEGQLEAISLHGKSNRFVVYHIRTHKAVTSTFAGGELAKVKRALGQRVLVMGRVEYNSKNEPLRIHDGVLQIVKPPEHAPTIAEMKGSIPDLIGDLCTEDYIESIRA